MDGLVDLAKANPKIASQYIEAAERDNAREHASERFGIASVVLILALVILGTVFVFVSAGFLGLLGLTAIILASATMLRVIVSGEWSDTSWFGAFVNAIVKALGGKPVENDKND